MSNQSNSCCSPAAIDKVASNDDLLVEIISRLPVRPLLRFKTVSKHWYFLISNPSFKILLCNRKPDPPSGLYIPVQSIPHLRSDFISFDIENPIKPRHRTPKCVDDSDVDAFFIEHSCNGLMLFSGCNSKSLKLVTSTYYIYNPTTDQFATATLPVPDDIYDKSCYHYAMNLAFDPSTSPHYKILYISGFEIDDDGDMSYQIRIYSSQTQTFKLSYTFTLGYTNFKGGVYWNNALHWVQYTGVVVYFNMDREVIQEIQPPVGLSNLNGSYTLFESRGYLLLVVVRRPHDWKVKVHELKRDYSGWFVKYHVDLEQLGLSFPEIADNAHSLHTSRFSVLSLVLGGKEYDDSFLVLEIPGKVVRFNLVSKTSHMLYDFNSPRPIPIFDTIDVDDILCQWHYAFQFMESLYSF